MIWYLSFKRIIDILGRLTFQRRVDFYTIDRNSESKDNISVIINSVFSFSRLLNTGGRDKQTKHSKILNIEVWTGFDIFDRSCCNFACMLCISMKQKISFMVIHVSCEHNFNSLKRLRDIAYDLITVLSLSLMPTYTHWRKANSLTLPVPPPHSESKIGNNGHSSNHFHIKKDGRINGKFKQRFKLLVIWSFDHFWISFLKSAVNHNSLTDFLKGMPIYHVFTWNENV